MAHEWTQEQRKIAEAQLTQRGDIVRDGTTGFPRVYKDSAIDLQCELNEARELLEQYKEEMAHYHTGDQDVDAWLSRNPQPPKEAK